MDERAIQGAVYKTGSVGRVIGLRSASTRVPSLTGSLHRTESVKEEQKMIKKVKEGYKVLSEKGKNLGGPYKTKAEAEKRLRQVEFFKHHK
jgi:ssDNA-binding replication factor A large subunit